jgi:hypothetical protein
VFFFLTHPRLLQELVSRLVSRLLASAADVEATGCSLESAMEDAAHAARAEQAAGPAAGPVAGPAAGPAEGGNAWVRFLMEHFIIHHDPVAFWQNVAAHVSEPPALGGLYIAVLVGWFALLLMAVWLKVKAWRQQRQRRKRGENLA